MTEAGQHRRLDVGPLDRLALDQGAAEALEGEDHRQRHEDQRHHGLAEAGGRDQAGQDHGGGEGDDFDADAGGRRPAHPRDGGILELLAGDLALGVDRRSSSRDQRRRGGADLRRKRSHVDDVL